MKRLLMVMVLGASAVAASAQGLQPRRTLGSRLARPRPQTSESVVGKEAVKVIPSAREGGTTWKYMESAKPLTNWGDLSFDDKDWKEGVSGFGNSYGLRRTVWSGGANDLYLRKTFKISSTTGQIERVSLTFAIDNDIEVLLNGSQLFARKSDWHAKYISIDVTKDFKRLVQEQGKENIIAVKAHDGGGGSYVDVGLEIVLSDTDQGQENVSARSAESQSVAHVADVVLIPFGGTDWKYKMQGEVEENWKSPDFNDAGWANGKTPFGNDTWTTPCICLRKKFDCPYEDADIKYLQIREGIDDVLDIWLNGSHIFHWTYHWNSDLTTVVPRKLWEGLLRRKDNVLTVLARDWRGGRFVNVGLTAMVRQSVGRELVCPTEYVPADMKLIFPATKLADIQVCSAVLTGDAVNWGRPTAVLASNIKSVGDVRKTMQFQRLENNDLKCACVELEQKGRDVWGRVLYCRSVNHCDVSCADFDTLLCPTHRIIDNDSEILNGQGVGYGLKEFTVYFASGANPNSTCTGANTDLSRRGLLGGGSLRARRLQRQQEAQSAAAKQQAEEAAKDAERQAEVAAEKAQREAERAEQRKQLLLIQEELKRVKEAKAAAAKSECATSCVTNEPTLGKCVVAEKLGQCDFLLNKDFKKNAKVYLCLFSASWCPPCRREMPRIAKTYAETLKDDPDIELIHFSRDQNDEKALAWAKEHDVKFPVVKPNGGNPLDLHSRGIPHLFIVKADGTLVEEGHPMRIFNEEKFREIKGSKPTCDMKPQADKCRDSENGRAEKIDGYTWSYRVNNGEAEIVAEKSGKYSCAVSPKPTGCLVIPSVLGGAKVTSIGQNAFYCCSELTSVTIPLSVRNIGYDAFFDCRGLTSVTIPDGVTSIGGSAFSQCSGLSSVTIPLSVTNLGGYSFYYCSRLKSIKIPSSVTSIGSGSFNNCRGMLEFDVEDGNPAYRSLDGVLYDKELTSLIQYPCAKSGTLMIPSSVSSIGHGVLLGCRGLVSIDVEEGNPAFCSVDGILYDKERTRLIRCPGGKGGAVTIPHGVTSIGSSGYWAFRECRGLTSVMIPSSVTRIVGMAFLGCGGLTSVTMCGERPDIGNEVFAHCDKLAAIHVPANAKSWAGMKEWQGIPLVFDAEAK